MDIRLDDIRVDLLSKLVDPTTDHRPGLNLDTFIESAVIFIAPMSSSIDKYLDVSCRNSELIRFDFANFGSRGNNETHGNDNRT